MEVVSGVVRFAARTPTLPPATHTNSYGIGDGPVMLVEPATPYDDELAAWIAWARELGRRAPLIAIVATHHHPDHIGGAARLTAELGLPLWAHPETASRIDVPVARFLEEGDEFPLGSQRWRVLHTPGHAPGHICLHEPALRVALVGDMVASVGTIVIDPVEGDLGRYLVELERLASLDLALALPAHGDPIPDPAGHFRGYIAHRRMREAKVLAAVEREAASLDDLLPRAYDDTPKERWPIARLSLESHLLELVRQGRIRRDGSLWHVAR